MILMKNKVPETERGSTSSHCEENWLCKEQWTWSNRLQNEWTNKRNQCCWHNVECYYDEREPKSGLEEIGRGLFEIISSYFFGGTEGNDEMPKPDYTVTFIYAASRVQLKCDGARWRTGGEVKGKLANEVDSQCPSHYLGTWCIQY